MKIMTRTASAAPRATARATVTAVYSPDDVDVCSADVGRSSPPFSSAVPTTNADNRQRCEPQTDSHYESDLTIPK